jgi:hypothetical protein
MRLRTTSSAIATGSMARSLGMQSGRKNLCFRSPKIDWRRQLSAARPSRLQCDQSSRSTSERENVTMPLYSPEDDEMAFPIKIFNKRSWFVLPKLKIDFDFAAVSTSSFCLAKAVS